MHLTAQPVRFFRQTGPPSKVHLDAILRKRKARFTFVFLFLLHDTVLNNWIAGQLEGFHRRSSCCDGQSPHELPHQREHRRHRHGQRGDTQYRSRLPGCSIIRSAVEHRWGHGPSLLLDNVNGIPRSIRWLWSLTLLLHYSRHVVRLELERRTQSFPRALTKPH